MNAIIEITVLVFVFSVASVGGCMFVLLLIERFVSWQERKWSVKNNAEELERAKAASALGEERQHIRLMGTLPPKASQ